VKEPLRQARRGDSGVLTVTSLADDTDGEPKLLPVFREPAGRLSEDRGKL